MSLSSSWAETRSSANYEVITETLDGGGTRVSSSNYRSRGSFETLVAGRAVSVVYEIHQGFRYTDSEPVKNYKVWASSNGLKLPRNRQPDLDTDGDLIDNAVEYAFGLHPLIQDSSVLVVSDLALASRGIPVLSFLDNPDQASLFAIFTRRTNFQEAGLSYSLQTSTDMVNWTDVAEPPQLLSNYGDVDLVTISIPSFSESDLPRFARIKIILSY